MPPVPVTMEQKAPASRHLPVYPSRQPPAEERLPDELLRELSETPTPIDQLVQLTELSVGECQQRLLMLELDGWVEQRSGGWVRMPRP